MTALFDDADSGAEFSECRKYRYALWRIWDRSKPLVMFIGLNPSTANEVQTDPTIRRVISIAKHNDYGGIYMMNCFPYVSTDPKGLVDFIDNEYNDALLRMYGNRSATIVFAWGNFDIVKNTARDLELSAMFPNAQALHINKNGSPKHPLYCRTDSAFIKYNP